MPSEKEAREAERIRRRDQAAFDKERLVRQIQEACTSPPQDLSMGANLTAEAMQEMFDKLKASESGYTRSYLPGAYPPQENALNEVARSLHGLGERLVQFTRAVDLVSHNTARTMLAVEKSQDQIQEVLDRYMSDLRIAQVQAQSWQDRYFALVQDKEAP